MKTWLVVLALAGCSSGTKSSTNAPSSRWSGPAILTTVPSDTPYLLAVLEPNEAFRKRVFAQAPERFAKLVAKAREAEGETWAAIVLELDQMTKGTDAEHWPEVLGLAPPGEARMVVYGLGVWPVVRIAVKDPTRVRAVIERLARAARFPLQESKLVGHAYWTVGSAKLTVVAAVLDTDVVFALIPTGALPTAVPMILGTASPRERMREDRLVPELMSRYGFGPTMIGFADTRRIFDAILGPHPFGLAATADPLRGPGCHDDLARLATLVPRLVFGYRKLDAVGFSASFVLETSHAAARAIEKLHTSIPPVPLTGQAMFAMAAAIDVDAMLAELRELGKDLRDHPFTCQPLREIDELSDKLASTQALPPMFHGIRGFGLVVEDATMSPPGGTGQLVAVGDRMPQIASQLLQMLPGARPVATDGVPVELPLEWLAMPGLKSAYVALRGDRAVVTIGPDGETRAASALTAPIAAHSPLFALSYDLPRIRERFGAWLGGGDVGYDLGNAALTFDVRDEGIVMDVTGTWAPPAR